MKRLVVLGTEIDAISFDEAIDRSIREMQQRRGSYVVTPNAEMLLHAQKDDALRSALRGAALALPDGMGVLLCARILGMRIPERIPGVDFCWALLERMNRCGGRVFLLGAEPGVAEAAAERIESAFGAISVVGCSDGYFSPAEESELADRISRLSPDLLIVCLGSPKQELWMQRSAPRLRVGLMAGLGGAMNVYAGRIARAPRWMRRAGLEWLFRLLDEPRRITRMAGIPGLLIKAILERIGKRKENG